MNAKFIVIEGLDGSGKSTQIRMLSERLRAMGRRVYETAEPTPSATGGLVRDALSGLTPRTGAEIAALFMVDRVAHNSNPVNGISVMLQKGCDVICDRYYYSSLAYQGTVTDPEWVRRINVDCPEIRRPDLCVFLDLSDEECLRRMDSGRAVREIYENAKALIAIRKRYYEVFRQMEGQENIVVVDAARSPEAVAEDVFEAVKAVFREDLH
ncbi:MAG: dTMP kinase [Oscillospiraceae bacterium]|nr:dTMP kinase [Oscillospiraceae bacterium]